MASVVFMEIEVIKESKLELEMTIHGENHSLCNVLRNAIDHPLTGEPNMTIKTKRSKRPRNSLQKAAERLKAETAEFRELIELNVE